jgi:excinuclease ABC subunit A
VVVTGPSGSGKSSLAFDTIHAEGQRRYVESFSTYARQFLSQMEKPDVEAIEGLSPTISIEQKTTSYNPRSTVGTVTEIYDFLRILYARISTARCYNCGGDITSQSKEEIADRLREFPDGSKLILMAPIARDKKGEFRKELMGFLNKGFTRARIDGEMFEISEAPKLEKNKKHTIEIIIDRLILKKKDPESLQRVRNSVDLALEVGEGTMTVFHQLDKPPSPEYFYSIHRVCPNCDISYPEPEPKSFSFNSPVGACDGCDGLGFLEYEMDEETEKELAELEHVPTQTVTCPACKGYRLRKESLSYLIGKKNISEMCGMPLEELKPFLENLKLTERHRIIAQKALEDLKSRISFLLDVGLEYLDLARPASTLSGGELQRIRLAAQLGSSLVGVTYVLDEPSIGLHPKDNHRLISTLHKLRDMGNNVIVVEHDRETMEASDWIIDIGPGAGKHGGELLSSLSTRDFIKSAKTDTANFLRNETHVDVERVRRKADPKRILEIKGCSKQPKERGSKNPARAFGRGCRAVGKWKKFPHLRYPLSADSQKGPRTRYRSDRL